MELVCDNISFAYNREVSVFQGFSHVFRPGITVLKGYSGSGKTTLLKLLAGYLTVTAGRIITPTGLKVTSRRYHRRDVAYMFQGINLLPLTSVERNLHLAAEMAMLPRREWKPRCETLLHDLGLEKLRNRRADKLSGGQAQRAALARTLMKNAPTILLDEQFLVLIIAVAVVYISENKFLFIESQERRLSEYQEYFLIGNVIITIFLLMLMCLLYMIERNRLQRKMEFYVNHDALTGVYNRRAFYYIIKDSIKEKYVIAMVDIDDFKKINDCYGHKTGDTVIVKVADVLSSNPKQEAVIRWGGEEFVVFFPESDIDMIYKEMDGVRRKIAQLKIQSGLKEFGLSVTVGLAQGTSKNDYEKVINLADEKLYIGKNNGKNTVVK